MWELKAVGQFVDCVLSVWNCECGQLVITGEMGASQMSPKPRDTDKNKPCLVSCVVSAQWRSRNVPVLTDSVQSQLSSPCNLTWIVWLWDVLKINNKMWQELDTFTNTEEKLFWLKPQNHIYYLLALQHCTRWEHISFCCVNHACMFSMFWKFMGESFFEYTAKKCQNIKLFTMRYRENSSARVLKCERVGTWPCLALNHWKSLTSRFQSVKLCSNN